MPLSGLAILLMSTAVLTDRTTNSAVEFPPEVSRFISDVAIRSSNLVAAGATDGRPWSVYAFKSKGSICVETLVPADGMRNCAGRSIVSGNALLGGLGSYRGLDQIPEPLRTELASSGHVRVVAGKITQDVAKVRIELANAMPLTVSRIDAKDAFGLSFYATSVPLEPSVRGLVALDSSGRPLERIPESDLRAEGRAVKTPPGVLIKSGKSGSVRWQLIAESTLWQGLCLTLRDAGRPDRPSIICGSPVPGRETISAQPFAETAKTLVFGSVALGVARVRVVTADGRAFMTDPISPRKSLGVNFYVRELPLKVRAKRAEALAENGRVLGTAKVPQVS